MPGDPSNPFNDILGQLNGVTFAGAMIGQISSGNVASDQVNVYGANNQVQGAGQITVVSYSYVAGYYQGHGAGYRLPSFGVISFSGNPLQFSIRGFSDDGLLLSPVTSYGPAYSTAGDIAFSGQGFVFSDDGFASGNFAFPVLFGYDPSAYQVAICFAEGTRLKTVTDYTAVEDLVIGDMAITASGEKRAIKWIGQMLVKPKRHARPSEVSPVRVRADAFGPGLPARDLRLSPGHAVFVDGVLVPVGYLVNGATIIQEEVEEVRYFHVELDSHDVLLAEGLPCESYLDDGNRASFTNAREFTQLNDRLDPRSWDDACAPMIAAGPQLVSIQQRLHARAEEFGWVRNDDADLRILADGVGIAPLHRVGNHYWFTVPAASRLTLRSNSGVLAHVIPGLGDGRRLGVAVARLSVDGEAIPLDADVFASGFYPAEQHEQHGWRWTDGEATLQLAAAAPVMIEVELAMVVPSWVRPAPALRQVA